MDSLIEDYALIGDTETAALVGRTGSIDWFCTPRFDSAACFSALLGDETNGRWLVGPRGGAVRIARRYRGETLVLETDFETADGVVRLIDFMPPRDTKPRIVRMVQGLRGRVPMRMELIVRFDYGSRVPWVRRVGRTLEFIAGPDALRLDFEVDIAARGLTHVAEFTVGESETIPFVLHWHPSHERRPLRLDPSTTLASTEAWWGDWSALCDYQGEWREAVTRSLMVLKALTYRPTGGLVAAPTTSLPERIGGVRNWDYRYCWLRDATFSLYALMMGGHTTEAKSWRDWLLRTIAGQPELMRIMYGPAGERRLTEFELSWLPGYRGSRPVRVGNQASTQFQLDVYGEVMDAMYLAARSGVANNPTAWGLQKHLMAALEGRWDEPDEGIWEVRGQRRQFTHSKVMAWVAADRAVRCVESLGLSGPVERWKKLRQTIHDEVCRKGYDPARETFTWFYGSREVDAALLMIPLVGFLPARDERVRGTVRAVQNELMDAGLVMRYSPDTAASVDGLPPGEGAFLPCTFWLADNLVLQGRREEARALFERLLGLRNDVGLLSEQYDPHERIMLGNFPQAFTHVSLVNTALNLSSTTSPAAHRPSSSQAQPA